MDSDAELVGGAKARGLEVLRVAMVIRGPDTPNSSKGVVGTVAEVKGFRHGRECGGDFKLLLKDGLGGAESVEHLGRHGQNNNRSLRLVLECFEQFLPITSIIT